jgi:Zn-dependent alcohol dehydrogenase
MSLVTYEINSVDAFKVNDTADMNKICLLGCGVSTGYGAALNTAKVEKDSTCAIWGLGAVGLSVIMGCKAAGAKKIIGIDINKNKFLAGLYCVISLCIFTILHILVKFVLFQLRNLAVLNV